MSSEARELYEKLVPRWWKVLRWREYATRFVVSSKKHIIPLYFGIGFYYCAFIDPYVKSLVIHKPQTEEERLKLKALHTDNHFMRDWEIDQYEGDIQPLYDTFARRRQYPQYYGNKYNGYKMHNNW